MCWEECLSCYAALTGGLKPNYLKLPCLSSSGNTVGIVEVSEHVPKWASSVQIQRKDTLHCFNLKSHSWAGKKNPGNLNVQSALLCGMDNYGQSGNGKVARSVLSFFLLSAVVSCECQWWERHESCEFSELDQQCCWSSCAKELAVTVAVLSVMLFCERRASREDENKPLTYNIGPSPFVHVHQCCVSTWRMHILMMCMCTWLPLLHFYLGFRFFLEEEEYQNLLKCRAGNSWLL